MKKENILYVVIPCYNEEAVLNETAKRLKKKINQLVKEKLISDYSRILFVNDGSKDKTWEIIKNLHSQDKLFCGISLSRNRGHQNALLAGLMIAKKYADIVNVYSIGDISKEICGGPHVKHTGELGKFKIIKEEASSAGVRRIKAILE